VRRLAPMRCGVARMERDLSRLQEGIFSIQDSYGEDHLHLTVVKGYLRRLITNDACGALANHFGCHRRLINTIKSSRFVRKDACSAFSSARAAATSGRSCSAACSVFFERNAVPLVKPPDRGSADLQCFGRCQPRADLVECQIGLGAHQIEQPPTKLCASIMAASCDACGRFGASPP
jgi:hypothetical protein